MRIALLAVLFSASVASATEPIFYDVKKLETIGGASFRPGDKQYPVELSAAGVQGEVLVIVPLTEDGMPDGALLGATTIDSCKANPEDFLLETWQRSAKAAS